MSKRALFLTILLFNAMLVCFFSVDGRSEQILNQMDNPSLGKCTLENYRTYERPGLVYHPTIVKVGLSLIDITAIEDITQSITADFVISITWNDPRLVDFEGCRLAIDEVWAPQIDITNSGRLFTRFGKAVEILGGGQVKYFQRYRGPLVFVYDAHRFPFDSHEITISLLSGLYPRDEVEIVIDKTITGRNPKMFNIPDWTIPDIQARIVSQHLQVSNAYHSAFEFVISAKRRAGYYIWKVILPLTLIVFMSWTVFWIDPAQSGTQIGMSATSMLTLIAFQFAMANILPPLSYFTVMDKFITGATILVFLALIESVTTSYLLNRQRKEEAIRMDHICRWAFPLAFAVLISVVFFFLND